MTDNPVPLRPLRVLVADDGSALANAVVSRLDPAAMTVSRVRVSADAESLDTAGRESEAVAVISDGWNTGAAGVVNAALDRLLTSVRGSGKRLLYVSSSTTIGDTGTVAGSEDSPRSSHAPHPWQCAAESEVMRAVSTGVRSIVVRPALVHGRGVGALLHALVDRARWSNEAVFVGEGSAATSTVHVDDVASLIQAALLHAPERATYMAASTETLTWREVAELIAASTGATRLRSLSVDEADLLGLDGAAMAISSLVRDDGAHRRLGWQAQSATLRHELSSTARRPTFDGAENTG